MLKFLSAAFVPGRCVHCDSDHGENGEAGLCRACERDLEWIGSSVCDCCGWPFRFRRTTPIRCRRCRLWPPDYRSLRTLGWYDGVLGSMIKAAKFSGNRAVFDRWLGRAVEMTGGNRYDAVVAVPSDHPLAREFAESLAAALKADVAVLINRRNETLRQVGLSRRARRQNAGKIFARRDTASPQSVLLFDDIVTTGATVSAAAALLREGGTLIVDAIAIGRTPAGGRNESPPFN